MKIRPGQIAEDGANTGDAIVFDGSEWGPGTPGGGATVVTRDRLTASAGDDTLTLGGSPQENSLLVWVGGSLKWPGVDYTLAGDVVTFSSALSGGDVVADYYLTSTVSPGAAVLSNSHPASIAFRAAAANSTASNVSSLTVAVPASVQAGDVMILIAEQRNTVNTPTGWTLIRSQAGSGGFSTVTAAFYKVAVAGDAGSTVTVTFGGAESVALVLAAYSGVSNSSPVNMSSSSNAGSVTSASTPTVTTTAANCWIVSAGCHYSSSAGQMSVSDSQRQASPATQWSHAVLGDKLQSAAGLSSADTVTNPDGGTTVVYTIALTPA